MKKLIFSLCVVMVSNIAFAEVGPLTLATQKYFAETGECYIKYYDYSQAKMMQSTMQTNPKMMKGGLFGNPFKSKAKDGKLEPSASFEFTKGVAGEANKREGVNKFKSKFIPATWNLLKNEKYYKLNYGLMTSNGETHLVPANKKGLRYDLKDCAENDLAAIGLNALPDALVLTLPDSMLPFGGKKYAVKKYSYDGSSVIEIDGEPYQCEQYSLGSVVKDKLSPFASTRDEKFIVKLFFKDGLLAKFEDRSNRYDVEQMNNASNKDLVTIPKGYTIYADTRFNMKGLLQQDVVLERY